MNPTLVVWLLTKFVSYVDEAANLKALVTYHEGLGFQNFNKLCMSLAIFFPEITAHGILKTFPLVYNSNYRNQVSAILQMIENQNPNKIQKDIP